MCKTRFMITPRWTDGFAVLIFLILAAFALQAEYVLIKDPKPTHFEKNFIELEQAKVIGEEIDDENFLAKPYWIATDDEGGFFVWDLILKKILKFDKNFNLTKIFLERGQGPGEIHPREGGRQKMYFSKDRQLYVASPYNKKIIAFDRNGNYIKDITFPSFMSSSFAPVVDRDGDIYILSSQSNGLAVFDKNLKLKYTLLGKKEYERFINHIPKDKKGKYLEDCELPDSVNTCYDVLTGKRLIVYLANSSTVYLFKEDKLIKHFDIWPEKALEGHKEHIESLKKKLKDSESFNTNIFSVFFVDEDNEDFFYLQTRRKLENKSGLIYKFDLEGNLVCIYFPEEGSTFVAKKNNLFYSVESLKSQVKIFKIKNKEIKQ